MKNGNMIFASLCLVGACAPIASTAGGTGDEAFMARFRPDSASHLYPVGAKATVEASVTDKAGKARTEGVVEIWADDEWTNVVWRRTADLAKESTVQMELSRQTPGSLRLWMRGNGFKVRGKPERIIFGVEDIVPLTQCPPDFEEYWRIERQEAFPAAGLRSRIAHRRNRHRRMAVQPVIAHIMPQPRQAIEAYAKSLASFSS